MQPLWHTHEHNAVHQSLDADRLKSFTALQSFRCTARHVREIPKHFTECIICTTTDKTANYETVSTFITT